MIEDKHLQRLVPKTGMPSCQLCLSNMSGITDNGLLAFLQNFPKLNVIDLRGCTSLTVASVNTILRKYPNIKMALPARDTTH